MKAYLTIKTVSQCLSSRLDRNLLDLEYAFSAKLGFSMSPIKIKSTKTEILSMLK